MHDLTSSIAATGVSETLLCPMPNCDREFASGAARADHVIDVHSGEPSTSWDCRAPECEQSFPTRAKRDAHEDMGHRRGDAAPREESMTETTPDQEHCFCGRPARHRGVHRGQKAGAKPKDPAKTSEQDHPTEGPAQPEPTELGELLEVLGSGLATLAELVADDRRTRVILLDEASPEELRGYAERLKLLAVMREHGA